MAADGIFMFVCIAVVLIALAALMYGSGTGANPHDLTGEEKSRKRKKKLS